MKAVAPSDSDGEYMLATTENYTRISHRNKTFARATRQDNYRELLGFRVSGFFAVAVAAASAAGVVVVVDVDVDDVVVAARSLLRRWASRTMAHLTVFLCSHRQETF